ncbi:MAG: homocysteine S-methyltransferase family protein [Coriobacteriales bacterium]|jgi:5-methyltetrahydrofolate--homocysteine methyltransferase|nr:homocysteine S-methyltransferase family protein [Coriobacteriales bacterium]
MADLQLRLNKDILILEGAMGTLLQAQDVPSSECGELLNVLDPELIIDIHSRYKLAGAHCAITNTFGGTRVKLDAYGLGNRVEELNRSGVRLAKAAEVEHVLADVGPCGLVLEPLGSATFDTVYAQYFEQISALAAEKPDAILIETMADIADARCALLAAKAACDLPIIVSCTFAENGRMDLSGTDPATAAIILEAAGAAVVGMNCGLGPEQMLPLLEQMARATSLPLLIQPNAGIPYLNGKGETVFPGTADQLADYALEFKRLGAQFIGSCCGSTPVFTGALYAAVGGTDVMGRRPSFSQGKLVLASPNTTVALGGGEPTRIIGERINPTGKAQLTHELERGIMSELKQMAEAQEQTGADLLDVNVGAPEVDQKRVLPAAALALVGFSTCPLVFDTVDADSLEATLKIYPGRALINSVNGDPASYERVFPLAKRYGAGVVVLALDQNGLPKTVEDRLRIVKEVRIAAQSYGLKDSDLIFDMLVMAAASSPEAPELTLRAVEHASTLGLNTVLGISNVSHGLPDRSTLNAAYVEAAITAGLSAAIVNPTESTMRQVVKLANAGRSVIAFSDSLNAWRASYRAALRKVAQGAERIATGVQATEQQATSSAALAHKTPGNEPGNAERLLKRAILRGDKDGTPSLIDAIIKTGIAAETIVDSLLTPTLQDLGDAFARGEAFLPQMMFAAEAMKVAVARIKTYLPAATDENASGRVLFCSVKGDVHSIGKDICVALLESQGFKVFDLGVDVAPEKVLEVARAEKVDVICLSALMTTTLHAMRETVDLIYREEPQFKTACNKAVCVGGAVVTARWAESIGARYSSDAPNCVETIRVICKGGNTRLA